MDRPLVEPRISPKTRFIQFLRARALKVRFPLRARFISLISALSLFAVLGASGFFYLAEKRYLTQEIKAGEDRAVTATVQVVEGAYQENPLMAARFAMKMREHHKTISFISVADAMGMVVVDTRPNMSGKMVTGVGPEIEAVVRRIPTSGGGEAVVQIGFSKKARIDEMGAVLREAKRRILLVSFIAVSISVLFAWVLGGRLARPIVELGRVVRAVRLEDFTQKVSFQRNDELGDLAFDTRQMTDRLNEVSEMRKLFINSAVHDLRSPITSVVSYFNQMIPGVLEENPREWNSKYLGKAMSTMRDSLKRVLLTIGRVLQTARIEKGMLTYEPAELDPAFCVAEVEKYFRDQAARAEVSFSVRVAGDVGSIWADEEGMFSILSNLVTNALKYTPRGESLAISCQSHFLIEDNQRNASREALFCVADTGRGIAPAYHKKIFEKFGQAEPTPSSTGLGLYIVDQYVRAHGGRIWVESDAGKGAKFFFTIPVYCGQAAPPPPQASEEARADKEKEGIKNISTSEPSAIGAPDNIGGSPKAPKEPKPLSQNVISKEVPKEAANERA